MRHWIGSGLAILALAAGGAARADDGWRWFAGQTAGFAARPSLALLGGSLNPSPAGARTGDVLGVEVSLDCPLLQPPRDRIRQQLSFARYDAAGLKLNSVELNPHYLFDLGGGLEAGFGPGIGYLLVESAGIDEGLWAGQVGTSVHYRRDGWFLGAEARYQLTEALASGGDVNSVRYLIKVGVDF